jgi:ketosteroid isomerase-like protein
METGHESDNVRLIRRVYAAWDAEDLDAAFEDLDPEFQWVNPDYAVEPGIRHGHEGFATATANLHLSFGSFHHVLGDFVEAGDKVLWHTIFCVRGRDSGARVEIPEQHLWTMRDGKVLRLQWFHDAEEAREAAGLG